MNKDVVPVAELNFPSERPGKFTWDLSPAELANTSRKHRSVPPEYHIQLGAKNDNTVPLTSTPKGIDPTKVPLPESPEISRDSENSLKSNSKSKVIIKQPNSSISSVSVDKLTDKSPSHFNTAFAKDVVLDTHALLSKVNDNTNILTATKADLVIAAPVGQYLPAIEPVVQDPVAQGEDPGVGIGPVAPVVPDPVGPVIQGHANAPPVVPLVLNGDNNNDSSDEEFMIMTDNVIAPPTFNGKAGQNPSDGPAILYYIALLKVTPPTDRSRCLRYC